MVRYLIMAGRVLVLSVLALLWVSCGLILCLVRPRFKGNVYTLAQWLTICQKVIGVKVTLEFDPQAVRSELPAVLVGLHQSNWDIVTMAALPQPGVVCVGKKSLLYMPIFGLMFYLSGNIAHDRSRRAKSGDTMFRMMDNIVKRRLSIWLFPEGTRSGYGPVGAFKTGALYTAMHTQVKVIPYVTSTYAGQIDLGRWDNGEVKISLLAPLDGKSLKLEEINSKTEQLRDSMVSALQELDATVRRPQGYVLPVNRYEAPSPR